MRKFFVYGTLRHGAGNPCSNYGGVYVGPATIKGTMFSLGGFPGISLEGDQSIIGDVFDVPDESIPRLDRYEGCDPGGSHNLYDRREIQIEGFDEPVFVYEFARNSDGYIHYPIVEGGDWLKRNREY